MALETTEEASGIAGINAWGGNILGHNSTGSYHHVIADGDRKNCGVCSDTHMLPKVSRSPKLWFAGRTTVTKQVINEHGTMRNEAVVTNRHELANERVGLNPAPLSNGCSLLNFNERSDEGVITDIAAI
jgi:hypothetical protein